MVLRYRTYTKERPLKVVRFYTAVYNVRERQETPIETKRRSALLLFSRGLCSAVPPTALVRDVVTLAAAASGGRFEGKGKRAPKSGERTECAREAWASGVRAVAVIGITIAYCIPGINICALCRGRYDAS